MNAVLKFLQSLRSLYDQGAIKNVDEAMDFAKNEFGEITEFLDAQIKNVFKKSPEKKSKGIMDAEIIEASFKPGMDKRGKMVKESPSQRQADLDRPFVTEEEMSAFTMEENARKLNKAKGFIDKLGAKTTKQKLFVADLVESASEGIFKNVDMGAVVRSNMYDDLIEQGVDEDTLMNIMYLGTRSDDFGTTLAKIKSNAMDEGIDMDETLDFYSRVFDEVSRIKKSMGGRINYAFGTGLKLLKLFGGSKKLQKAIDDAVDNLNPSGDKKLDADMAVDNMLEEAGIDKDAVDQYDIIDAYGKAYDKITKGPKNVFSEVDIELEKKFPGVTEQIEAITKRSSASIKRDTIAKRLGLDPFELNEQQKMVLDKYGNKIDDDLLKNILIDDDPQRIAEVTATIDEAFIMQDKGMGADEILETVKNTTRTKQAMGTGPDGLSEITDLFEKIKIKNVQKQKDQEDNKQMRFRKLLASNKFPELNTFLEAELNEDDEKVELDVRTNLAAGGSPFTAEQVAQKKQQSYLDYLARQGATAPASTGAGYRGGASSVGANLFSTPATSTTTTGTGTSGTGTSGTSGGTGGTSGGGTTSSGGGFSGGSSGGGSSGGGSTGSSGGGTSSGGSNVYTGAGNFPPGMGTNTGGGSTGSSGGGSGLTPNTGASNVGGGGFGGTGSIVGGGTGTTGSTEYFDKDGNPASQFSIKNYEDYLEGHRIMKPNHGAEKGDPLSYSDWQYSYGRHMEPSDTGDLGSEAANIAANQAASALPNPYEMSSKELRNAAQQYVDAAKSKWLSENPGATEEDFSRGGGRWIDLAEQMVKDKYDEQQDQFAATADDGFEDQSKDMGATADDGFEVFTDSEGIKRIDSDTLAREQFEFLQEKGVLSSGATLEDYKKGRYAGSAYSPRDPSLWKSKDGTDFRDRMMGKYGTASTLSPNPKTAYTQVGGGADFAQITSLPETSQFAQSIQGETNDKNILQKANEFATKHGKTITAASYLLDAVAPGAGKIIRTAQAVNKGYNLVTGARDAAMNDVLTKPTGITEQVDLNETLSQGATPEPEYDGNISSIFFSDGGRVNKAVGGSLDLEARRKQSYEDYLARQPGAQPAQPQAPTAQPAQPVAPQPAQPAAPQPFDMSKYQGGTFTGGIEDSRNIALGNLMDLGVDVSKYRSMTPTDTSGPKFQGLSLNEIFAMDEQTARDKLGFDPAVEGANTEFEEFLRVNDPGPQMIGPGGPPGMKTEFKNQDELAQILNRAIPSFMQYAKDIGEDYTLEEMLAMSDEELAEIEDRRDKKMGYGIYAKTPAQPQYTGPTNFTYGGGQTGIATPSYNQGGRVGFRYGGEKKRVKKYMKPNYDQPFDKISKSEKSKFNKLTSTLSSYAKNLNKLKKQKATTAAQKNLLVQNEKARKNALKRLDLLKKMYSGSKRV